MVTPRDQFIDSIERKRKQLDEVLEAYKIFRQKLDALPPDIAQEARKALASEEPPVIETPSPAKKDLAGKTSLECAKIILIERSNEPQHFSTIAKESLRRGYSGRLSGSPEEVESRTANSFWSAMSRAEELKSVGKGLYKLRSWPPTAESDTANKAQKEKGRLEQLKDFLRKHGPMERKKILERSGIPEGTISMYLREGPDSSFMKDGDGLWHVLEPDNALTEENGSPE